MATRTIVTSQPDVACDVCERRLLRGEQPDVFIAAGRRLIVCELCAPRAAHEGWLRERDTPELALPPARARRGRGLLERLRGVGRPIEPEPAERIRSAPAPEPVQDWQRLEEPLPSAPVEPGFEQLAVEIFNESPFPRRIAGLARSLGDPEVSVAGAEHLGSVVRILVAWELSWYRYEVDLSEPPTEAVQLEHGTELGDLRPDERIANAHADSSGALSLL